MWIFSRIGFFSAVEHRDDDNCVMIRARVKDDIKNLADEIYRVYGKRVRIVKTPTADYRYRITVEKAVWGGVLERLSLCIDYDNFKNEVHDGTTRDYAYMDVWQAMYGLQNRN